MKNSKAITTALEEKIINAFMEIVGTVWGINARYQIWSDEDSKLFNNKAVDVRNNLIKELQLVADDTRRETIEEIEKKIPKESHINYHDEDGVRYLHDSDMGISIHWEQGYNKAIQELHKAISEGEEVKE